MTEAEVAAIRLSLRRRGAQEFVEDALGVPVSLGTVGGLERES
jgi:hypothetical protein